eukprot:269143_1
MSNIKRNAGKNIMKMRYGNNNVFVLNDEINRGILSHLFIEKLEPIHSTSSALLNGSKILCKSLTTSSRCCNKLLSLKFKLACEDKECIHMGGNNQLDGIVCKSNGDIMICDRNGTLISIALNDVLGDVYEVLGFAGKVIVIGGIVLVMLKLIGSHVLFNQRFIESGNINISLSVLSRLKGISEQQQQRNYNSQHTEMAKRNQLPQQQQHKYHSQHKEMAKCSQSVATPKTS